MTDRDRLIELIMEAQKKNHEIYMEYVKRGYTGDSGNALFVDISDYLLANGVIVQIDNIKAEAYKEFLPLLEEFRNEVVDKFIIMCDGNDYNKLNLMSMVDTIDCIYDKHIDNLLKELVGE